MKFYHWMKLAAAIVICELVGVIGSVFTMPSIQGWYAELAKPALNPPSWIFGPAWTVLYALMGISLFLVCIKGEKEVLNEEAAKKLKKNKIIARVLFGIQLVLNALWSIIFFGLQSPGGAFIEIIFLWFAILAVIIVFAKISRPAAWLLVPYILWVSFAAYLNCAIWTLNYAVQNRVEVGVQQGSPIIVESPVAEEKITSPLVVKGIAKGSWFFEASFPLVLTDWDGKIIATSYATAEKDWMTEDYVPFSGTLTFTKPAYGTRGFLILKKDNPSDLPQFDDSREIPLVFE